ncbi:MAG: dihydrofolate reductase family protein, partial [Ghiorsea sp.]
PDFSDIKAWRKQQGLKPQPDVVILSHTLDIPLAALATLRERKLTVLTTSQEQGKIMALQDIGATVLHADQVTGSFIKSCLRQLHYRSAYMIAGPHVFQTLLADGSLDSIFLTTAMRLLGGTSYHTILEHELVQPLPLQLQSMYWDAAFGQLFQQFSCT